MALNIKADIGKAQQRMRAIAAVLQRPLVDVLDSGARVLAIEMARTAQPFGTGAAAKTLGEKAVAKDIRKVYALPGDAYYDIAAQKWKKLFWVAYKAGEIQVAQSILNLRGSHLRGVPLIYRFDGGTLHKAARDPDTGRVNLKRPRVIMMDTKGLERYIKMRQGNVGFGKGGFADIARQISDSVRGLKSKDEGAITANWITGKAQGLGKVDRGGSPSHPTIRITSTVSYASRILGGSALSTAKKIARDKMLLNLRYALAAEIKKLRTAA